MPPQEPIRSSQIKWNEVTWYSKLGAVILFLGVVPALCFYIGTQYGLVQQDTQFATQSQRTLKLLDQAQQMQISGSSHNIIDTNDFLGFLHNGFPIFPACVSDVVGSNDNYHSPDINLNTCGITSYADIASSTTFSLSDDKGWFDLQYQAPDNAEQPDLYYMGEENYKVNGIYHGLYIVNSTWHSNGTASSGTLSVLKINGNTLHLVKVIATAPDCSEPDKVTVNGALVSFIQLTPGERNDCSGTTYYQYNLDTGKMSSSTTPSTTLKIHINSMEPTSGPPGTIVTLHGTGFNDPQLNLGFNCLDFNIEPVTPACSYTMHAGGGSEPIMNMTTSTIVFKIDDSTPVGRYEVALYDTTKTNSDGSEIKSDNSFNFTVTK